MNKETFEKKLAAEIESRRNPDRLKNAIGLTAQFLTLPREEKIAKLKIMIDSASSDAQRRQFESLLSRLTQEGEGESDIERDRR